MFKKDGTPMELPKKQFFKIKILFGAIQAERSLKLQLKLSKIYQISKR